MLSVLCGRRCAVAVLGNSCSSIEGCLISGRGGVMGDSSSLESMTFSSLYREEDGAFRFSNSFVRAGGIIMLLFFVVEEEG